MPVLTRGAKRQCDIAKAAEAEVEEDECSVCYAAAEPSNFVNCRGKPSLNNMLACPNNHHTCLTCVKKLIFPTLCTSTCGCSGFSFSCPLCRATSGISKVNLMVLLKGELNCIPEVFGSHQMMQTWNRSGLQQRETSLDSSESSDES